MTLSAPQATRRAASGPWARRLALAVAAGLALAVGCGTPTSRRPELYAVRGRVLDAETKEGVTYARLLLRASIATNLGPKTLVAYGVTGADGSYLVELSEGYDVIRYALGIRLAISKRGYGPGTVDIPPPTSRKASYELPEVFLRAARPPGVPAKSDDKPIPWQK